MTKLYYLRTLITEPRRLISPCGLDFDHLDRAVGLAGDDVNAVSRGVLDLDSLIVPLFSEMANNYTFANVANPLIADGFQVFQDDRLAVCRSPTPLLRA